MSHATDAEYQRGCRCLPCSEAHAVLDKRRPHRQPRVPCPNCGEPTKARAGRACFKCPRIRSRVAVCTVCAVAIPATAWKFCDECRPEAYRRAQRRARHGWRHRLRAAKRGATAEPFTELEIFERDGWRCHLCRRPVRKLPRSVHDPRRASLDHIVPLARGGEHVRENVACSHLACNLAKSDRMTGGVQPLLVG